MRVHFLFGIAYLLAVIVAEQHTDHGFDSRSQTLLIASGSTAIWYVIAMLERKWRKDMEKSRDIWKKRVYHKVYGIMPKS